MKLRDRFRYALCELGHVWWIARVAHHPKVHPILRNVKGIRIIYDTGWNRRHPFDREHGIDTSSTRDPIEPHLADHPASRFAHFYAGSQPGLLRTVLAMLPTIATSTFIDLGCGKGRPLFVASEFPFRDIVGIELSPQLAVIAEENAAKIAKQFPTRARVRIEVGDAGAYTFPPGDIVLFLYHPFEEPIIVKVVAALEAALAEELRSFYLIYYNPVFTHCFDSSPALSRTYDEIMLHDEKERGFGVGTEDRVTVWRGGNSPSLIATGKAPEHPRSNLRL